MDPACVGCERVLAVTSGYCQTCSDTAEAWSTERAERLERTLAGLKAAEQKGWTVCQLDGLRDPDYIDRLYRQSMVKLWPEPGHRPGQSWAVKKFVEHETNLDPLSRWTPGPWEAKVHEMVMEDWKGRTSQLV